MNDLNIGVHRQQQARCMLTGVLDLHWEHFAKSFKLDECEQLD